MRTIPRTRDDFTWPVMNKRNRLYWSVFIQFLAREDILDLWLDNMLGSTLRRASQRARNYAASRDREMTEEDIDWDLTSIMASMIQRQTSKQDIGERFSNYYGRVNREGNRFHGMGWNSISKTFARECIHSKRTSKVRLGVIIKARGVP